VEFEFDEDQLLLRQSVREILAKTSALPSDKLWATYTALGWLEAPPVELAIVLDELGYVADPTPFLATATWFAPLAGRLPEGSGTGVFDSAGRFVLDADRADEVALPTGDGVVVVSGAEVTAERLDTFDLRMHVAHLSPAGPGNVVRLDDLIRDAPSDQDWYASLQLDVQALRLLGYEQLSGGRNPASSITATPGSPGPARPRKSCSPAAP
jgi:hypothetical protein